MAYNFNTILEQQSFRDFNNAIIGLGKIAPLNHTMIGYNFKEQKILSTKFYYVFYDNGKLVKKGFPIPILEKLFNDLLQKQSTTHLTTKNLFGGGITLTIKFDKELNPTQGFYFRVSENNNLLVENITRMYPEFNFERNDFEDGYGQYVLFKNNNIVLNEYLYLRNTSKIPNSNGIAFSKTNAIEISSANSNYKSEQKFIAFGNNTLFNEKFLAPMPLHIKNSDPNKMFCPAININNHICSIYLLDRVLK